MIDKLLKLLKIKFAGEATLKGGTVIQVDGDIEVGASVSVQSPDGLIPLPDGEYELENGEILTAKDGKIESITDVVDTNEEPDVNGNPPVSEVEVDVEGAKAPEMPEETKPDEKPAEKPESEQTVDPIEELQKRYDDLEKRLADLESKLNLRSEIETEMKADIDFIKTKTLVTELKKSNEEVFEQPMSRMDVIKNLKNKHK